MKELPIEEIIKLIPHRYPLLLVDRLISYEKNKNAVALKNVTFNEPHFTGHFPDKPIMPGVLIVEALAQTSAILVAKSSNSSTDNKLVYFMSINDVKFRKPVLPGTLLTVKAVFVEQVSDAFYMKGSIEVEGKRIMSCDFTCALIDPPQWVF